MLLPQGKVLCTIVFTCLYLQTCSLCYLHVHVFVGYGYKYVVNFFMDVFTLLHLFSCNCFVCVYIDTVYLFVY